MAGLTRQLTHSRACATPCGTGSRSLAAPCWLLVPTPSITSSVGSFPKIQFTWNNPYVQAPFGVPAVMSYMIWTEYTITVDGNSYTYTTDLVNTGFTRDVNTSLINLPSSQFTTTQNPTYTSGDKMVTEITLLNSNKETLVVAKTAVPLKRSGTQVFAVKLDF